MSSKFRFVDWVDEFNWNKSPFLAFKLRTPAARVRFWLRTFSFFRGKNAVIFHRKNAEIQWPQHCLVGGQCRGLIVIRTHPALVRAVQQKKAFARLWRLLNSTSTYNCASISQVLNVGCCPYERSKSDGLRGRTYCLPCTVLRPA